MNKVWIKQLIVHNWLSKLLSLILAVLLWIYVNYQKLPVKYFTLPLNLISMPKDYVISDSYNNSVTIKIKGPQDIIQSYTQSHFQAYIDFKGISLGRNILPVKIKILKRNNRLRIINITPSDINVTIDKFILKELPVTPTTMNSPAEGYVIINKIVTPKKIIIGGPAKLINELTMVRTKPIDIGGITGSIYKEVEVDLPNENMSLYDPKNIQVSIKVKENFKTENWDNIKVDVKNLSDNLILTDPKEFQVHINIMGPSERLEKLKTEGSFLFIDLNDITTPGVYKIPITYELPWNCKILQIEPKNLSIILEEKK